MSVNDPEAFAQQEQTISSVCKVFERRADVRQDFPGVIAREKQLLSHAPTDYQGIRDYSRYSPIDGSLDHIDPAEYIEVMGRNKERESQEGEQLLTDITYFVQKGLFKKDKFYFGAQPMISSPDMHGFYKTFIDRLKYLHSVTNIKHNIQPGRDFGINFLDSKAVEGFSKRLDRVFTGDEFSIDSFRNHLQNLPETDIAKLRLVFEYFSTGEKAVHELDGHKNMQILMRRLDVMRSWPFNQTADLVKSWGFSPESAEGEFLNAFLGNYVLYENPSETPLAKLPPDKTRALADELLMKMGLANVETKEEKRFGFLPKRTQVITRDPNLSSLSLKEIVGAVIKNKIA